MSKTTAPRVRQTNLYTIESDGQPVAQAMAISQAEAVRLYVESVQQPVLSARLSSPLEARTLAGLPLLTRGEPVRDEATPDLFDGVPAAPVSPVVLAVGDSTLPATYCPPVVLAATPPDHGRYGCDGVYRHPAEVPPQHAPIEAVTEGLASGAEDLPGESVAGDCAEPASPPADASPASADAPTLSGRMAGAYAAGMEFGKRGLKRISDEMLTAEMDMLRAAHGRVDADAVHAELLRGFNDGKAQADQAGTEERRRLFDEAPKGAGKAVAKYRNPETGESWSGRGLRPAWLRIAIDGGRAQEDFLI